MRSAILVVLTLLPWSSGVPQSGASLLKNGNFASLEGWSAQAALRSAAQVRLLAGEQAVELQNPLDEQDATLSQTVAVNGHRWFRFEGRVRTAGGARASMAVIARDAQGRPLRTLLPFRIGGARWEPFSTVVTLPESTERVDVALSVLHGTAAFAGVRLSPASEPKPPVSRAKVTAGQGFAVQRFEIERPQWEIAAADLDGDGRAEVVACDVDGLITVRRPGGAIMTRYATGDLVREFALADVDGDGIGDILFTVMSPATPLRALNLKGEIVRTFPAVKGPQRVAAADMDGDGRPEIAASLPGGGIFDMAGVVLLDLSGSTLWSIAEPRKEFHFGDVDPAPGVELVVLSPAGFEICGRSGPLATWDSRAPNATPPMPFSLGDVDGDGRQEALAFYSTAYSPHGRNAGFVRCVGGGKVLWETYIPEVAPPDFGLLHTADFVPAAKGLETVLIGTYGTFLFDRDGGLIYSRAPDRQWTPGGLHAVGAALFNPKAPELYIGSSAFRDRAYYRLGFGDRDELSGYRVPDREKHLDAIYNAVNARKPLPKAAPGRFKVVLFRYLAGSTDEELKRLRRALDRLETPSLEYTVMYDPSDLLAHPRGSKLTVEEIAAQARRLERARLPFGYFAAHGNEPWLSEEAIRRTIEAAPSMFRFIYTAEDFASFYGPQYRKFLSWCDRMLSICVRHNLKFLLKEKHDAWGLIAADPDVAGSLFKPEYRAAIVPIYSTNQPYQPEVQWGGMLGLKQAGWCKEFGMSTQFWNWHEWWVRYLDATHACPADIMSRLELLGAALGGTWFHIEGSQPYLEDDPERGFVPSATRRFELVHAMVRKNLLPPGAPVANQNRTVLVRSLNAEFERAKAEQRRVVHPYYGRNVDALRRGLLPATWMFEPYPPLAFPRLAYDSPRNGTGSFPTTPRGWVAIVPEGAQIPPGFRALRTDGERVLWDGAWTSIDLAGAGVRTLLGDGADNIPVEAAGATMVLQGPFDSGKTAYRAVLIDPEYLAPSGVETILRSRRGRGIRAADLITGESVNCGLGGCAVSIAPGAFRLLELTIPK